MMKFMSTYRKTLLFCLLSLFAFSGCEQKLKFDTQKWMSGDGIEYPVRDRILDDLLQNYKLKGMTYKQVQHLLGEPQGNDSVSIYYTIENTYDYKGNHKHIKNLVLLMKKDSIITGDKIYEFFPKKK